MDIIITAQEALDKHVWGELCDLKGINPWAINEGLMQPSHEIHLTLEEAQSLGIIKAEGRKEEDVAEGSLRVWWVQNPPRKGERYPVKDVEEAIAKLDELAQRDLALGDAVVCNAGGLEVFEDGEWSEYYNESGDDIGDIRRAKGLL